MSEPVVNPSGTEPVRGVWPVRLLVAAAVLSPVPVTVLAYVSPEWGDAVQTGFTPGPWLFALAVTDWSRLRR